MEQIKHKKIPCLAGGVFPSSVPERLLKEDFVDYVCRGEGEGASQRIRQIRIRSGKRPLVPSAIPQSHSIKNLPALRQQCCPPGRLTREGESDWRSARQRSTRLRERSDIPESCR